MKLDFETLAANLLAQYPTLLFKWLPGGKLHGIEFKCGNLNGDPGDSLAVNIKSGKWSDFATGDKGGDPISLYAAIYKIGQGEAFKALAEGTVLEPVQHSQPLKRADEFRQIIPAVGQPMQVHPRHGVHAAEWPYHTIEGELIGYIRRYDMQGGGKEIVPFSYGERGGKTGWHLKAFAEPRPLFNLPALKDKPKAAVLLVEGEKTATAAAALLPSLAVLSWPGGSKAHSKADFSPLAGRRVLLLPDNDDPGFKAMGEIAGILSKLGCKVKFCAPPMDTPKGWDLADYNGTPDDCLAWLKASLSDVLPEWQPAPQPQDDSPPEPVYEPETQPEPQKPRGRFRDAPFRILGYERENFYFFNSEKQQIIALTASQMTANNLLTLASKQFWVDGFRKGKTNDFDTQDITDALVRASYQAGIFNMERLRGRGAWWDNSRLVVHLGDVVLVNNKALSPSEVESRFVYEAAERIGGDISKPLSTAKAHQFMKLMESLSWAKPYYGKLAAGWCVAAHIGGVLHWRPHIWIIGAKGSGKTYVVSQIIKPILDNNCVFVQSNSSEAGIRQELGYDSLPVLFEEFEGETDESRNNVQRVLSLIRQSSSETGGRIAKGTPGGKAKRYMVRSCFAMSSVNAQLVQNSDRSRVTVLELSPDKRAISFEDLQREVLTLLTPEFIQGFYARAIELAPVIRKNAVTFARAASVTMGEQRAGDQIGVLLAGAYSLHSKAEISYADAEQWIKNIDWSEEVENVRGMNDEYELFDHLLQQSVRVKLSSNGEETIPIDHLIQIARGKESHDNLYLSEARKHLMKYGFRLEDDDSGIWIANRHVEISRMLKGHKHCVGWNLILKRINGAKPSGAAVYFGAGIVSTAAVYVPFKK